MKTLINYNSRFRILKGGKISLDRITVKRSCKFKIMEIEAIVGHSSPEMIMKNYAGFIKDNHLKIDTSVDLFKSDGHKSVTHNKYKKLLEA